MHIHIRTASTWYYCGDGQTIPSPWVQNGTAAMNWTTGYFDIGNIQANQNYDPLAVYARLYNWLDELIGEGSFFSGAYTANTQITGTQYLGMASIPSYGYKVVVYIEESY